MSKLLQGLLGLGLMFLNSMAVGILATEDVPPPLTKSESEDIGPPLSGRDKAAPEIKLTPRLHSEKRISDYKAIPGRAVILVEVPENSELSIDGNKILTVGKLRVFKTPELRSEITYYYDLTLRVLDPRGERIIRTRVTCAAGKISHVRLE
jgi:uncharacterized protein (TIGR03000 family)